MCRVSLLSGLRVLSKPFSRRELEGERVANPACDFQRESLCVFQNVTLSRIFIYTWQPSNSLFVHLKSTLALPKRKLDEQSVDATAYTFIHVCSRKKSEF